MFSSVLAAVIQGLDVTIVSVEMDVSSGLPMMQIAGSVATEVKEGGERVRTAIKNLGYQLQPKKIICNITPVQVRKSGAGLDLAIAVSLLASYERIPIPKAKEVLFIGELGLDGNVHRVKGIIPIILEAKKQGIREIFIPIKNAKEAIIIEGIAIYGVRNLEEIIGHFSKEILIEESHNLNAEIINQEIKNEDFEDIVGQEYVKRAIKIAVSGHHNLLMIGPPGSGKSMMSKRIPSILPDLNVKEKLEISQIHSVLGLLEDEQPYIQQRPFRSVHHTITKAALIGGGMIIQPGEISMAHEGVLFLDELPEFNKSVLEVLRQPLEERKIRITRSKGSCEFPANFMLIAAMNPCPCGNYPDTNRCSCKDYEIKQYLHKISQPLLDRIDLCIEVSKVSYESLISKVKGTSSKEMKESILYARRIQEERYKETTIRGNAEIPSQNIEEYCKLNTDAQVLLEEAYNKMDLTARTYYKVLKVARTIADIEGDEAVSIRHVTEALGYRMIDKKYWGR